MMCRCPHCAQLQEYFPKKEDPNRRRKRCINKECVNRIGRRRTFTVKYETIYTNKKEIVNAIRLTKDYDINLITRITEQFDREPIMQFSRVRELTGVGSVKLWRVLNRMAQNGIITKKNKFGLFGCKSYIARDLGKIRSLTCNLEKPSQTRVHFLKFKIDIEHYPMDLETNLKRGGYKYNRVWIDWPKFFVYLKDTEFKCIEINQHNIMINYNGCIITDKPKDTLELLKGKLEPIINILKSLGLKLGKLVKDIKAHYAFMRNTDLVDKSDKIYVDESPGLPESEIENDLDLVEDILNDTRNGSIG